MSTSFLYHSFGLVGCQYIKTEYRQGQVLIYIRHNPGKLRCPACDNHPVTLRGTATRMFKSEWPKMLGAAIDTMDSYPLILFVLRTEIVSYVVALRQCSVVFAVLIGWIVLKEKYGKRRLFASLLMFSGLYFVPTARVFFPKTDEYSGLCRFNA